MLRTLITWLTLLAPTLALAAPGTLYFTNRYESVTQPATSATVYVNRTGGTDGVVGAWFNTGNSCARAGVDYTSKSGWVTWAAGDAAPKPITIALLGKAVAQSCDLGVGIWATSGGARTGTSQVVNIRILPAKTTTGTGTTVAVVGGSGTGTTVPPTTSALAVRVSGGKLVDGANAPVQLRGVNVSGLESVALQGWSPGNPWGGQTGTATPNWALIKSWGANAVRIPLNEASWLGYQCAKNPAAPGTLSNPDPGSNYKGTVQQSVVDANAAGLYVILDLHWSAPNSGGIPLCPMTQNAMAASDHAPDFWRSVATTFKSSPAVIFELFNEPFVGEWSTTGGASAALRIRDGGTAANFMGPTGTAALSWSLAGMQSLLDAVRSTGATNLVLVGSDSWSQQVADATATLPVDPAKQLGAAWHPYPIYYNGVPQARCVNLPACSATALAAAKATIAAGYPVVITEFGDTINPTPGANSPWSRILLPFADANGISYLAWAWDTWSGFSANVLVRDGAGTPTYGYGEYVKAYYQCRATGATNCQ